MPLDAEDEIIARGKESIESGDWVTEDSVNQILEQIAGEDHKYDLDQVIKGAKDETEHCHGKWKTLDDPVGVVKTTLTHLDEDPMYYDHLEEMLTEHGVEGSKEESDQEENVSERLLRKLGKRF